MFVTLTVLFLGASIEAEVVAVDSATPGAEVVAVDIASPGADRIGSCTSICDAVDLDPSDPIDSVTSPIMPLDPSLKKTLDEPSLANYLPGN